MRNGDWIRARVTLLLALALCALAVSGLAPAPARALRHSATVDALVKQVPVDQAALRRTLNELSGETPATVGGAPFTFVARFCDSGSTMRRAEQYVYERLLGMGLGSVAYQPYQIGVPGRNVVGEIRGSTRPEEIVVIGAHLDDTSSTARAPGADDNASSCAALLWTAEHFAGHSFARTIRFVFFGSEEAGYYGSNAYAAAAKHAGEKLVAVVNADMIGWNGNGSRVVELHTRRLGPRAAQLDLWTGRQYLAAVAAYGIKRLRPRIVSLGKSWSDQRSFWAHGYGATCLIEDELHASNPYYHTPGDTVAHLTWPYYLRVTKGLVATAAHLAYIEGTLPASTIYVSGMTMTGFTRATRRGVRARVVVRDASFTPVLGATVRGTFAGAAASTVRGVTDARGRVVFTSPTRKGGGTWQFTVDAVTKAAWAYSAEMNVRTSMVLRYPR